MTLKREFGRRCRPGYAQGVAQGGRYRNCLIPNDMPRVPRVPRVYARACAGVRAVASFPGPSCGMGVRASHGREGITHGTPGTLGIFFFFNHLLQFKPKATPWAYLGHRCSVLFHDKHFDFGREGR